MAQRPDPDKERLWLDLIRRWQRSQLTVREFCERRQVSEPSFYSWRRVLRERGLIEEESTAQASRRSTPSAATTPAFVKLVVDGDALSAPTSAIDLVLSERRLLRVHKGFDAATLLELVRLLEEPTC